MKIFALNPPFIGRYSRNSRSPAVTKGGTLYYPIWLSSATGMLEKSGHDLMLVDAPAEGLDMDAVIKRLTNFIPDVVVIDTSTPSIHKDIKMAEKIKDVYPATFCILVGTHPSALPEETLQLSDAVDAVTIGEYDLTLVNLMRTIEEKGDMNSIPGLAYKNGHQIVNTGPSEKIENLDQLPFLSAVYKKYLKVNNYFFAAASFPMVMIMTGRGCPYHCFFCLYPQVFNGRNYRVRSPENVVEEFSYIQAHLPEVREIGIEDDCFTANKPRVKKICDLLIEKKNRMQWYANVRADLDYDLLLLMKQAGCRLVTVGFESGSQEILDNIKKGIQVETYLNFIKNAKKAGVLIHGCIVLGNPGETEKTLKESYDFALKANCDSMQFYPLFLYPGTEAFFWARENGYLSTEDYSKWLTKEGMHTCVINPPGFSGDKMQEICNSYLVRYHFRPRYLGMKLMQGLRYPSEGFRTAKSALYFIPKALSSLPFKVFKEHAN